MALECWTAFQPQRTAMTIAGRISNYIGNTPIGLFPVHVRAGIAKGSRWTLLPFSSYWRNTFPESDVTSALAFLPDRNGIVFWDIGAHFGIHSIGIAKFASQVIAIEPDPIAFKRLKHHIALNKLLNVRALNCAASSRNGSAMLAEANGNCVSSISDKGLLIRTKKLDDLALPVPDLIKIDTEGHGAHVISGAIKTISHSLPVIAFSNHSTTEWDGTGSLLEPLGYQPHSLDGHGWDWMTPRQVSILTVACKP